MSASLKTVDLSIVVAADSTVVVTTQINVAAAVPDTPNVATVVSVVARGASKGAVDRAQSARVSAGPPAPQPAAKGASKGAVARAQSSRVPAWAPAPQPVPVDPPTEPQPVPAPLSFREALATAAAKGPRKYYAVTSCRWNPAVTGVHHTTWNILVLQLPGHALAGSGARLKGFGSRKEAIDYFNEKQPGCVPRFFDIDTPDLD